MHLLSQAFNYKLILKIATISCHVLWTKIRISFSPEKERQTTLHNPSGLFQMKHQCSVRLNFPFQVTEMSISYGNIGDGKATQSFRTRKNTDKVFESRHHTLPDTYKFNEKRQWILKYEKLHPLPKGNTTQLKITSWQEENETNVTSNTATRRESFVASITQCLGVIFCLIREATPHVPAPPDANLQKHCTIDLRPKHSVFSLRKENINHFVFG